MKNCPFCGEEAKFENMGEFVVAKCEDCGAESDMIRISAEYCANEKAAEKWNQRINQPPKAHWTREDVTSYDGETIKNGAAICGRCKKAFFMPTDTFDYCPNCGARMDLIETDDDLLRLIQKKTEGEKGVRLKAARFAKAERISASMITARKTVA